MAWSPSSNPALSAADSRALFSFAGGGYCGNDVAAHQSWTLLYFAVLVNSERSSMNREICV
jgi:hypothetical protein